MTLKSPNYPKIGLPEAIERSRTVYELEHTNSAPREVIATAMGYSGMSGASARMISAVFQYGLFEQVEKDLLRISDDALNILLYERGNPQRLESIRRCAGNPKIYRELKEAFPGNVPSDTNLRAYLVKRGFHPNAVKHVVESYRETLEFVAAESYGVETEEGSGDGEGIIQSEPTRGDERKTDSAISPVSNTIQPQPSASESLVFQISRTSKVRIAFEGPVTQESIRKLVVLLEASLDVYPSQAELVPHSEVPHE